MRPEVNLAHFCFSFIFHLIWENHCQFTKQLSASAWHERRTIPSPPSELKTLQLGKVDKMAWKSSSTSNFESFMQLWFLFWATWCYLQRYNLFQHRNLWSGVVWCILFLLSANGSDSGFLGPVHCNWQPPWKFQHRDQGLNGHEEWTLISPIKLTPSEEVWDT